MVKVQLHWAAHDSGQKQCYWPTIRGTYDRTLHVLFQEADLQYLNKFFIWFNSCIFRLTDELMCHTELQYRQTLMITDITNNNDNNAEGNKSSALSFYRYCPYDRSTIAYYLSLLLGTYMSLPV